ncbi:MAG: FAD-binding protein, partial [Microgenomates group bacterium]
MDKFNLLKKTLGKKVKENEPMGSYTTVKIGGPARLFIFVEKEKELIEAVRAARKFGIEFLVIGEGSNILVHDRGFEGLVVRNCVEGTKID